tara:strand:- start:153 stop:1967 length:1815 start_codon:yes stop_codon:yes gene_type:complete
MIEIENKIKSKKIKEFWKNVANHCLVWEKSFNDCFYEDETVKSNENKYFSKWKWFKNGEINLKKTFFGSKYINNVFLKSFDSQNMCKELTYKEFLNICIPIIDTLKTTKSFEKVLIIGRASPETTAHMISVALMGGCHTVLFEDLSSDAIQSRIEIFSPKIIFIRDGLDKDKIKKIELKNPNLKILIYSDFNEKLEKKFITDNEKNILCSEDCLYKLIPETKVKSNKLLFCLFTSGSTGKPKAIWHSYGGYLVYAFYSFKEYFTKSNEAESFFCGTDAAWINGHTYAIYGPLLNNVRSIFVEDLSSLQRPDVLSIFINKVKPTFFYSSVTLMRALRSYSKILGLENLDANEHQIVGLGSCGEPLADEVGKWAIKFFNPINKHIVNTYFQTETGGILMAPRRDDLPILDYATVGKNNFPMNICINDDSQLIVSVPWPGCFSMVTSDRKPDYWDEEGNYLLHDLGSVDKNNFFFVGGRSDDVINISGHRVSTAEIESTFFLFNENISESAAVGVDDPITGSKLVLFYVSNEFQLEIESIKSFLTNRLSLYHRPWKIIKIDCLPKTKSGKIARRLLRNALSGNGLDKKADLSTITNYNEFIKALSRI